MPNLEAAKDIWSVRLALMLRHPGTQTKLDTLRTTCAMDPTVQMKCTLS